MSKEINLHLSALPLVDHISRRTSFYKPLRILSPNTPLAMPSAISGYAPDLEKYLKSLKGQPLELSIENLISYEFVPSQPIGFHSSDWRS